MEVLELLGHVIAVEDNLITFNNARMGFKTNINYAEEKFRETYESHIKSLDDLVEKVPGISSAIVESMIDYAIGELVKLHIMDCDKEKFIDKYFGTNFDYSKYFSPFAEKYIELEYAKEQIEEYRNLEKMGRSKWRGGGFGLGGAVKGGSNC